jgi:hypothetical protein
MPERKGDYFADKKEAIEYYKTHEKNLEDKPDWLIECIIDFAIQYPNYKEYCEVEARVKNGQELTQKQKKKYGSLKWDRDTEDYKDGQVLPDTVEVKEPGAFDDLTDHEVREKYNKYNLDFGKQLEPSEDLVFRKKALDGTEYEARAKVADVAGKPLEREDWDIRELNKVGELDLDDPRRFGKYEDPSEDPRFFTPPN